MINLITFFYGLTALVFKELFTLIVCVDIVGVPVTELEAGRACRAMSGCDGLGLCSPDPCWALDIPCWLPSAWPDEDIRGCWEAAETAGRCGGRIFSAISCSLILLIKTRLSSWQPETTISDRRTVIISSISDTSQGSGALYWLTPDIAAKPLRLWRDAGIVFICVWNLFKQKNSYFWN